MKGVVLFILLLVLLGCATERAVEEEIKVQKEVDTMKLRSNDFNDGNMIPSRFTCQGDDVNPHLAWSDVPSGTKSFALIFDDPDAPGGTFVHWLVKDIPADAREIQQDSVPGTQVANSWGKEDYGGPCPPALHRYFFRLYALNVETFEANSKAEFYKEVQKYAIAKAELMGKFKRS